MNLKTRNNDTSSSCVSFHSCFRYPVYVCVFQYEGENCLLMICEELWWNFEGHGIESVDYFPFYYVNPISL